MATITPTRVRVTREYAVSVTDEPVPDSVGTPLDPETAFVRFTDYGDDGELHPSWVGVRGRRLRGKKTAGTYNEAGYSVGHDGVIEPHHRNGFPPHWVQEVVNRAIRDQAEGHKPAAGAGPTLSPRLRER